MLVGQGGEPVAHRGALKAYESGRLDVQRIGEVEIGGQLRFALGAAAAPAQGVDRATVNDGKQKGAEVTAPRVEALTLSPQTQKGLLHGVLRVRPVAQHTIGKAESAPTEEIVETRKRLRVTAAQRLYQAIDDLIGILFLSSSRGTRYRITATRKTPLASRSCRPIPHGVAICAELARSPSVQ